ncbi:MAG: hypothetical protein QOI04_2156 [Verrucomicrobiota bacterium]
MHFDNLFFILLIAGAALLRWLAQKAKGDGNSSDREEPPPVFREPDATDEEQVRRFFEALGQPTSSKPPPRVTPRADIPPRPVAPVQPPREMAPPVWRRPQPKAQTPREIKLPAEMTTPPYEKRIFKPKIAQAPAYEVSQPSAPRVEAPAMINIPAEAYAIATQPATQRSEARTDYVALFRSTYKLRDVIVLREIFGPPRALQHVDLVGGI